MYSATQRASIVFSSGLSTALTMMAIAAALSYYFMNQFEAHVRHIAVSDIEVQHGRIGYYHDYDSPIYELHNVTFDLQVDFTPLFNWNTKLVFAFLVIEFWHQQLQMFNQVTVWDGILRPHNASLDFSKQGAEYWVYDIANQNLDGVQGNMTLYWNAVPWVGSFVTAKESSILGQFQFPIPSVDS